MVRSSKLPMTVLDFFPEIPEAGLVETVMPLMFWLVLFHWVFDFQGHKPTCLHCTCGVSLYHGGASSRNLCANMMGCRVQYLDLA